MSKYPTHRSLRSPRAVARSFARAAMLLACVTALVGAQQRAPVRLSLAEAAERARDSSLTVTASTLREAQTQARVQQRRADLLPNILGIAETNSRSFNTATLGLNFPSLPGQPPFFDPNGEVVGPVPVSDVRTRVQQTVFDGAVLARLKVARSQSAVGRTESAATGAAAATQASIAYVRAMRAEAALDARAADSTLAADLVRIARETLRAGTGVALDVTRAQSQLVTVQSQLIAARVERDKAHLELHRVINLDLDQPIVLTEPLDGGDLTIPAASDAQAIAVRERPEVQVLDAQLDVARLGRSAIRAERLPVVNAVADNGFIGKDPSRLLNTWTWALRVQMPVFEGGRRRARETEQELAARELSTRKSELLAAISIDVRSALLDAASTREVVAAARERLQLAEQEVKQARDRFTAGVAGNLDVTTALLGLNAARTQLIDALAARHLARISMARSQGSISSLR
jgi:outer membrane protein